MVPYRRRRTMSWCELQPMHQPMEVDFVPMGVDIVPMECRFSADGGGFGADGGRFPADGVDLGTMRADGGRWGPMGYLSAPVVWGYCSYRLNEFMV